MVLFPLSNVFADQSAPRSLHGSNYAFFGTGTTIVDEGFFDSRELSIIAQTGANISIAPHLDLGFTFTHERVDGDMFDGEKWKLRENSMIVSGKVYGSLIDHLRPYVIAGIGGVHLEVIVDGEKFSDTTHTYGIGGGIEIQMFSDTLADLSFIWHDTGKLRDSGFEMPASQSFVTRKKLTQFFSDNISGSLLASFSNADNNATFGARLNLHF
jgi:opacity protein-like surface antigen